MDNAEKAGAAGASGGAVAVRSDDGHGVRAGDVAGHAVSETAAILSLIERAARDPNVDVDKMERLFAMQQKAQERNARLAFDSAFSVMQPKLPEIDKRGKIIIKAKDSENVLQSTPYALWDDTNRIIKPILAEHGFGLSFRIAQTPDRITTTAVLSHVDGHREETGFSAPIDATGSKNNVQGWGSSMSYGKRYAATAILNITTRGEDDDGKAAGAKAPPEHTVEALRKIVNAATDPKATTQFICQKFSVESFDDLSEKQIGQVMAGLAASKRKVSP